MTRRLGLRPGRQAVASESRAVGWLNGKVFRNAGSCGALMVSAVWLAVSVAGAAAAMSDAHRKGNSAGRWHGLTVPGWGLLFLALPMVALPLYVHDRVQDRRRARTEGSAGG